MFKLSVIIPTFNCGKHLPVAVESLLRQTYQDFEIVIVDDGSKDDTREVVDGFLKMAPGKIKYIYQENKGEASARNRGISEASGDYVCFLDSDDYYTDDSIELRLKALDAYKANLVIGKRKKILDSRSRHFFTKDFMKTYTQSIIEGHDQIYLCDGKIFFRMGIQKGFFVDSNSILFRKDFLLSIGLFDENQIISTDIDLWFRAFLNAEKFVFIDKVLSICRFYLSSHAKDLYKLYLFERKRYVKHIKILNQLDFDKGLIRVFRRRIAARKFKEKGILAYRQADKIRALKFYLKSLSIYGYDPMIIPLALILMIPSQIKSYFKAVKDRFYSNSI